MKYVMIIILTLLIAFHLNAQKQGQELIDSLESQLDNAKEDSNHVKMLSNLASNYHSIEPEKGISFAQKGIDLASKIKWEKGIALSQNSLAINYRMIGELDNALEYLIKSLKINQSIDNKTGLAENYGNIGNIYQNQKNFENALTYYNKALAISEELEDEALIVQTMGNIGVIYQNTNKLDSALKYYKQVLEYQKKSGNEMAIAINIGNTALIYQQQQKYEQAVEHYLEALELGNKLGDYRIITFNLGNLLGINLLLGDREDSLSGNKRKVQKYYKNAVDYGLESVRIAEEQKLEETLFYLYDGLSSAYQKLGNFNSALIYFKEFVEHKEKVLSKESQAKILLMEFQQEKELKDKQIELQRSQLKLSTYMMYASIAGFVIFIVIIFLIYNRYRINQRAKRLLEEKNKLEIENRKKVINLFGQQVSQEIVDELLHNTAAESTKKTFVCIMFLDIRGFTPLMENKEPEEIIEYQNSVFGFMIEIINKHHGIINQFLGDGYMATFGAPVSKGNDCQNAFNAADEIYRTIQQKNKKGEIPYTDIGIGLHAGNVVAGNVGTSVRKQYSITGNTVILASRIEQLNKKFGSNVLLSKEVLNQISKEMSNFEDLGLVDIKGCKTPINIYKYYL